MALLRLATCPSFPTSEVCGTKPSKTSIGQPRELSEAVLVRKSSVKDGKAVVPAGGLCYISETDEDAAPFRRDPFLLLGEHAYLVVDSRTSVRTREDTYQSEKG